jgi:hypothetical protein
MEGGGGGSEWRGGERGTLLEGGQLTLLPGIKGDGGVKAHLGLTALSHLHH